MLKDDIYVQIYADRIVARNVKTAKTTEVSPPQGFSHPRALIGNFSIAEVALKEALAQVRGKGLILRTALLIHPMEKTEGGLTQIEERVFKELALGAGASKYALWLGSTLTDAQVSDKL